MANFTTEQVEVQIRNQLIREGFNLEVVNSAALQGANHYIDHSNATITSSLEVARIYAKSLKRIKGKPILKPPKKYTKRY